jgi:outer membrane protein assembly complex protein YaeT
MTPTYSGSGAAVLPAWNKLLAVVSLALALGLSVQHGLGQTPGADAPVVESVTVVGLRSLTQQQITGHLRTVVGQPLNPGYVQEDLRELGNMKLFRSIKVDYQEVPGSRAVRVYFVVDEYPNLVREIVYKYAHHMKPEELEGVTGLKRGLPLNPAQNRKACQDIVENYKKDGRYFASCFLEEGGDPGDSRVVFNITEGPVVRIGQVSFTGNDNLASSARLRTQIDEHHAFLGVHWFGSKFDPRLIDSDAAKLEEYYQKNGYLDARVSRQLIFSDDHTTVDVVFHIIEGNRYHVQDVTVKGTKVLPSEQVSSILRLHKGDLYDEHVVEADCRNITDLYGYRGYPAAVDKRVEFCDRNTDPGLVRVHYQVMERGPYDVGEIFISGNDVTKNRVILRMLQVYPGQTLSYPAMKESEKLLMRSNLFDNSPDDHPTVTTIEREDVFDPTKKDILVKVKETMTGSLMFGASVNSDAGLVGSIVLNERNFDILRPPTSLEDILEGRAFRGGGQEFRLEAVPGTQVQRYSASWREPYLFDMPYSLTVSGYFFQRANNEDLESRTGMNIALGHQLNRYWSITGGLRVENVNIGDLPPWAPPAYTSVQGNNFVLAPRVTIARDDRDSFLRPTEGGTVAFTYEQLLGDFTSPILSLEATRYFTVHQRADGSGRQVVALRSQVAWTDSETPVFEKFFAGGIRSLRGFEYRGVGPFVNGDNVGGDFMWLNSIEYQLPVLANDQVYLVAFVDSGTVERDFAIHDYRVAAGFGIRIQIPMLGPVPLAFDFGFPIVRGPDDREQVFQFYFGINR